MLFRTGALIVSSGHAQVSNRTSEENPNQAARLPLLKLRSSSCQRLADLLLVIVMLVNHVRPSPFAHRAPGQGAGSA